MKLAAATFFGLIAAVSGQESTDPVVKVLELLKSLHSKSSDEGESEAKTFQEFTWFCEDTQEEKRAAIKKNTDTKETLETKINAAETDLKTTKAKLRITEDDKADNESEQARRKGDWANTVRDFEMDELDMTKAIRSLEGAIKTIKGSADVKAESFLSMDDDVQDVLRDVQMLAESAGIKSKPFVAFLQGDFVKKDYDFHSDGIIDTLEGLKKDFKDKKQQIREEHQKEEKTHNLAMQNLADEHVTLSRQIDELTEKEARLTAMIGEKKQELKDTIAVLEDDKAYLKNLVETCDAKTKTYNQRKETREAELKALQEAIDIIGDKVASKTTQTVRFLQLNKYTSLLQKRSSTAAKVAIKAKGPSSDAMRQNIVDILKHAGSKKLAVLATSAGKDPLAKVKVLIQELVLRLQKEASEEAEHHGWCVKQTDLAEQKRDENVAKVQKANNKLATDESTRDRLDSLLRRTKKELKELKDEYEKAEKLRKESHDENMSAIKEAEEGEKAIGDAVAVLKKFYNEAKKKEDALIQQQPEIPDVFNDEYEGDQDTAEGIFAMIEVIQGDFTRTQRITKEEEAQEQADFLKFETANKSSVAEKESVVESAKQELRETLDAISEGRDNLKEAAQRRDHAVGELVDLHAACEATGQSYGDRVAARREEIKALKQALEIFENWKDE